VIAAKEAAHVILAAQRQDAAKEVRSRVERLTKADPRLVVCLPKNPVAIQDAAIAWCAWAHVRETVPELAGDAVARKELAAGSTVHVAMDGRQGTGGESRDFLGRARVFHVGLVLVALSMSVPVVEALTEIDERGRMNVRFLDPLEDADEEMALEEKGKRFLNNYTASLERFWVENPGNIQIRHLRHYLNLASAPQAGPTDAGNPQGKEQASA